MCGDKEYSVPSTAQSLRPVWNRSRKDAGNRGLQSVPLKKTESERMREGEMEAGCGGMWEGMRGISHSEHRFPAPSLKEGCRKPVLAVWEDS